MTTEPLQLVVEICHQLAERNFTSATGGNISVRLDDGSFLVTPARLHKARVQVADLVRVDGEGNKLSGERMPSSETLVHLAMYRELPMAGAVIHAHPPVSTGFAQARLSIDTSCSSEAYAVFGPEIPLIPYDRPSTKELAELVATFVEPKVKAYLMANHGVLTWGADLWEAYDMLDTLEIFAQSLLVATQLGGAMALPDKELGWLAHKFR